MCNDYRCIRAGREPGWVNFDHVDQPGADQVAPSPIDGAGQVLQSPDAAATRQYQASRTRLNKPAGDSMIDAGPGAEGSSGWAPRSSKDTARSRATGSGQQACVGIGPCRPYDTPCWRSGQAGVPAPRVRAGPPAAWASFGRPGSRPRARGRASGPPRRSFHAGCTFLDGKVQRSQEKCEPLDLQTCRVRLL